MAKYTPPKKPSIKFPNKWETWRKKHPTRDEAIRSEWDAFYASISEEFPNSAQGVGEWLALTEPSNVPNGGPAILVSEFAEIVTNFVSDLSREMSDACTRTSINYEEFLSPQAVQGLRHIAPDT